MEIIYKYRIPFMELMMYIFEVPNSEVPHIENNTKFDWKAVQEKGDSHAI